MSTSRLAYDDDAATLAEMTGDCVKVGHALHLPEQHTRAVDAGFVGRTRPVEPGTPRISDTLACRVADLELHL